MTRIILTTITINKIRSKNNLSQLHSSLQYKSALCVSVQLIAELQEFLEVPDWLNYTS